jgi:4-amino-4-deoxy-L-arabinose transferase-like glycosyltransferase
MKFIKEWKWVILAGVLLLLAAAAIRLYHLTLIPVFADEAIYIRWAQVMGAEPTLRFLPLSDGKQPLFMWFLMFYVRRMADPLLAGRILSVVSGIGTMLGIFAVSYLLFKNKLVSFIAAVIYAVSPFTFFFDRMALVDSMLTTFGVWTLFFGILTARTRRLDMAMITGFFLGAGMLTKSPAIFFALLLPVTWLLTDKPKRIWRLVLLFAVTLAIGYGMFNILRLGPNFNLLSSRNQDYVLPLSHIFTRFMDPLIPHFKDTFRDWFPTMGPWPILILGAVGILVGWRKYWREKLILLAWWCGPLFAEMEYAKVFTARYILFTLPPLFILSALGIIVKNKILKIIYLVFFGVFIITASVFNWYLLTNPAKADLPRSERSGYLEEWTAGDGIAEVARYLKNEEVTNPGEKIVVGTEGYFGTLPDGLQMYLNDAPKIIVIGVGLDLKEIPKSLKESKAFGNKTYLVINKSRLGGNPEKMGLKLIASYPKAPRRVITSKEYIVKGPQEVLYFFEVD